ncbi:MAG: VOC family protein [Pseudomonadota bacterium]
MPLTRFDHVNIRTADLEGMTAWYVDTLGLRNGPRPEFAFPGAWLYLDDVAVIHLVGIEEPPLPSDSLGIEHFAFRATGAEEFLARLKAQNVPYREIKLDAVGLRLCNIHDPDGNHIHVDFPIEEAP